MACGAGDVPRLPPQFRADRWQQVVIPQRRARCWPRRYSMIFRHTTMPKTKVALTLDAGLLDRVDHLVARQRFRNRSQAIESALAEKLARMARTRLAEECAKLDPAEEQQLADEGLAATGELWPEY